MCNYMDNDLSQVRFWFRAVESPDEAAQDFTRARSADRHYKATLDAVSDAASETDQSAISKALMLSESGWIACYTGAPFAQTQEGTLLFTPEVLVWTKTRKELVIVAVPQIAAAFQEAYSLRHTTKRQARWAGLAGALALVILAAGAVAYRTYVSGQKVVAADSLGSPNQVWRQRPEVPMAPPLSLYSTQRLLANGQPAPSHTTPAQSAPSTVPAPEPPKPQGSAASGQQPATGSDYAPKTAPPHPSELTGYRQSTPKTALVRTVDPNGTFIDDFPILFNRCAILRFSIRWRSIEDDPVRVRLVGYRMADGSASEFDDLGTDTAGLIVTQSGCRQPVFTSSNPRGIQNVSVEYIVWGAAP